MRNFLAGLCIFMCGTSAVVAQLSVGIDIPGVSIGVNLPAYPQLVPVPGYPVYYAPQLNSNYFFYDGLYWVYQDDNWYASSWFNGPWEFVSPEAVPVFVLRVPVRYYRRPPAYFRGWSANAPPRWGDHWGPSWEQRRVGWDNWNRSAVPPAAPLPTYQRQYSGNRYPRPEQQQALQGQDYRYQPHDAAVQQRVASPRRNDAAPRPAPAPSAQAGQGASQVNPAAQSPRVAGTPPPARGQAQRERDRGAEVIASPASPGSLPSPELHRPPAANVPQPPQVGPMTRAPQQPAHARREPPGQPPQLAQRPQPVEQAQRAQPPQQAQRAQPPQQAQRPQPAPQAQGRQEGPGRQQVAEQRESPPPQNHGRGESRGGESGK